LFVAGFGHVENGKHDGRTTAGQTHADGEFHPDNIDGYLYPGINSGMKNDSSDTGHAEAEYVVFEGTKLLVRGSLLEAALAVYRAEHRRNAGPVVALDALTSEPAEPDTRGGEDAIHARYTAKAAPDEGKNARGRPKLGVAAREVTLLPRHWEWLEKNPAGASAKLRVLVEEAMRRSSAKDRRNAALESVERFANAVSGNLENAEEVSRALYAGKPDIMEKLTAHWPTDVRSHYLELARKTRPE
jgi:hypothetical protein